MRRVPGSQRTDACRFGKIHASYGERGTSNGVLVPITESAQRGNGADNPWPLRNARVLVLLHLAVVGWLSFWEKPSMFRGTLNSVRRTARIRQMLLSRKFFLRSVSGHLERRAQLGEENT